MPAAFETLRMLKTLETQEELGMLGKFDDAGRCLWLAFGYCWMLAARCLRMDIAGCSLPDICCLMFIHAAGDAIDAGHAIDTGDSGNDIDALDYDALDALDV